MKRALMASVVLVAGCASQDSWLTTSNRVLFSNATTIKIQWDSMQINEAAVREKAVAHCGGREVEVIDADRDTALFGMIRSKTWRCVGAPAS